MKPVLTLDDNLGDGTDYTLNGPNAWVTVGDVSVYIVRRDDGCYVELMARGMEGDSAYDQAFMPWDVAKQQREEMEA